MNEAELVLTEVLKCDRVSLYLDRSRRIPPEACRELSGIFKRRCAGESLYYILGKAEFMGFEFRVTADCLVPRPETELLVETVSSEVQVSEKVNILDIGTGSGCIAVTLARMLPEAVITATDISPAALDVARDNALRLGVKDRINFVCSDVFPPRAPALYDCIVSNPPYIRTNDIDCLSSEVRSEPRIALDGGPDGLDMYRFIVERAHAYLSPGGILAMELGFDQADAVQQLIADSKKYKVKQVILDYNSIQRIVVAYKD
ncbi:MAG: peptide chain release factor N(5)-glutamine methyltransferase [Candidatus Omnitrophota bacterium]